MTKLQQRYVCGLRNAQVRVPEQGKPPASLAAATKNIAQINQLLPHQLIFALLSALPLLFEEEDSVNRTLPATMETPKMEASSQGHPSNPACRDQFSSPEIFPPGLPIVSNTSILLLPIRMYETKARIGKEEVEVLEREFKRNPKPTTQTKCQFAEDMGVDLARINVNSITLYRSHFTDKP
jgi:hypothetical protein